jgi:hypothetical protein
MYPVDPAALDPVSVEVADALALLRRLHIGRNRRPIAETITMLLEAVRAHAGIALSPTGDGYLNELPPARTPRSRSDKSGRRLQTRSKKACQRAPSRLHAYDLVSPSCKA